MGVEEVGLLHRWVLSPDQVDHAKSLHYIGTGVAFSAGLLFVCLHCALCYHGATAPQDLAMAYVRIVLAAIAFVTLILSILPGQGSQELILYLSLSPPKTWGGGWGALWGWRRAWYTYIQKILPGVVSYLPSQEVRPGSWPQPSYLSRKVGVSTGFHTSY